MRDLFTIDEKPKTHYNFFGLSPMEKINYRAGKFTSPPRDSWAYVWEELRIRKKDIDGSEYHHFLISQRLNKGSAATRNWLKTRNLFNK
jgi:hypothetical protein